MISSASLDRNALNVYSLENTVEYGLNTVSELRRVALEYVFQRILNILNIHTYTDEFVQPPPIGLLLNYYYDIEDEKVLSYLTKDKQTVEDLIRIIPIVRKHFPIEPLSLEYDDDLDSIFIVIHLQDTISEDEDKVVDMNFNKYMKLLDDFIKYIDNPNIDIDTIYV